MGEKYTLRAAILAALALPLAAQAQEVSNEELLRRIEEQEQKILVLERKLEINDEAATSARESTAVVGAGPKGFSLRSADGKNQLRLRGTLHLDGRYLPDDDHGVIDTFQATRVRPTIEGTLGGIYDFRFMPDFGQGRTVIQDAYVTARFNPAAQLTVGKFKSPVGLERLQGSGDIRWVQRAFPTALVPNRDIGLQLGGDFGGGRFSYQAAFLNGSNDGSSSETFTDTDINDDKEYALRLFTQPFAESRNFAVRGLGFGIAGTYTDQAGDATQPLLPTFRSPGQATFFRYRATGTTAGTIADGERTRIAPQLHYYAGSFGLIGEYTEVSQDVSRIVAARGLVLPGCGRSGVPRLQAQDDVLALRGNLGRIRGRRARAVAVRQRRRLRRRRGFLRGSACGGEKGRLLGHWPKLVPEPERQVAARLRAHDLRGRCRDRRPRRRGRHPAAPRTRLLRRGDRQS